MITIVTSENCPYCSAAKDLINSLWFEYKEKVVDLWSDDLRSIVQTTWMMTVPQVFVWDISRDNLLGWYTDIKALNDEWKLVSMLEKS